MGYALITGASRGIGAAIATELALKKYDILAVARSEKNLKDLVNLLTEGYHVKCEYLVADLSTPDGQQKMVSWCKERTEKLDILVNNAGFGLWGRFVQLDIHEMQNMMHLNMDAVVTTTHHLLPLLHKAEKAYILNVASTAAYQAVPTLSVYCATKAFVLTFSRGLRWELRKSNVKVSCLVPGPTDTGFISRAKMDSLKETAAKFNMDPVDVAYIAVRDMLRGKAVIIPGSLNLFLAMLTKFLPKWVAEKIAAGIYEKNLPG